MTSANFAVPPSQNTASVVRFRCLYTHDLRRKAKRWQDGFVRYHTFNKRVMVFDDQGNFVGDLHWRQDEMIQDGDEMELDKGVLIQVGESMDKTETDLSPLFERRRRAGQAGQAGQGSSSQRNAPPVWSMPWQSSQQSRSLNELLGIKRTPVERLRSPYEQRQSPRPPENPDSRPAKRQRTSSPEDTEDAPKRPVVIDLEQPNKPIARPSAPAPAPAPATFRRPKVLGHPGAYPRPPIPSRSTPTTSKNTCTSANAKPNPESHSFSEYAQSTPQSSASKQPSSAPTNTLQLSKEKPRKKLMYRALLPGQANSEAGLKSSPQAEPDKSRQENVTTTQDHCNVHMASGDSTLDILAETMDDPMSDAESEPDTQESNTGKPVTTPAEPESTPTPPIKNEPSSQPAAAPAAVNHAARSQDIPPAPTKQPSRSLQKSYSDPSAFHTVNSIQSRELPSSSLNPHAGREVQNEEDETPGQIQEQGPWTCEAMDLFDFWPPNWAKP